jgi:peptidoglycan/LPS O-acetylase OafA/YrhL
MPYLRNGDINVDSGQLFAGAFLVPRILRDGWQFAPEGSLWFVLVIVQYYLLFPLLLRALNRIGPWMFLAATLTVTITALSWLLVNEGDLTEHRRWIDMLSPFRVFEFGLGMTLGYLLARRPQVLMGAARAATGSALVAAGAVMFVAACLIASDDDALAVVQGPAIVLALTLMVLPLIVKAPGAIERSTPARALAWVGVISYTVLIVSEPLRSVTHTMRVEHAGDGWIALWGVAVYLPLTLVLARPLAVVLGLVDGGAPRQRG